MKPDTTKPIAVEVIDQYAPGAAGGEKRTSKTVEIDD